ncbi:hypothetical protein EV363DRAFT_1426700 [Boletus edulis]|nr:hypothetical protein EV363DRAFT_1426700 [Boletus edulis]
MERAVQESTPIPASRTAASSLETQTTQVSDAYIVHSCFLLSFPIHLIYVLLKTKHGLRPLLTGLNFALTTQMTAWRTGRSSSTGSLSVAKSIVPIVCITAFYNLPGLLWFIAVSLASVTDVTAIWNANAFFAYIFSVKLLGVKWGTLPLFAVIIATLGVLTVSAEADPSSTSAPLTGDMLTLVASVLYGLYQVLYKRYIALPTNPELTAESGCYRPLPDHTNNTLDDETVAVLRADDIVYPPPFGLHPNLITATIGLCTLLVFWIPIPFLHYYQIETFRLPTSGSTLLAIATIATSGVVFNAGLMILLGIWGPVVTSVGNLLTLVLTLISDLYFGTVALTFGGLLGAGMIICAFGVLVYDMF